MTLCQYHKVLIFAPLKNNASSPERAHNPPQTVATFHRSLLLAARHTCPSGVYYTPPSSQPKKFAPTCLGRYQMPEGGHKQKRDENQS